MTWAFSICDNAQYEDPEREKGSKDMVNICVSYAGERHHLFQATLHSSHTPVFHRRIVKSVPRLKFSSSYSEEESIFFPLQWYRKSIFKNSSVLFVKPHPV